MSVSADPAAGVTSASTTASFRIRDAIFDLERDLNGGLGPGESSALDLDLVHLEILHDLKKKTMPQPTTPIV